MHWEHTAEELEVIHERLLARRGEVLAYGAPQEQDEDHGGGYPERAVEVRVTLEHVEEVGAREQRRPAPLQDGGRVDVEELRVEGHGP